MYVLIRVDVDHENTTFVGLVGVSDSLAEMQDRMSDEWDHEMASPSMRWVDEWDEEYSKVGEYDAACDIETAEWSVHWHIFDTELEHDCFDFI